VIESIHLACAADRAYLEHSAAMLHSAISHRGERPIHVHYLADEHLPSRLQEMLREMVEELGGEITFLNIPDERVAELPVLDFISVPMWFRIFLPELLPTLDRILYLDIDTIVVDSLRPLWEIDLGDSYLGAVTNVLEPGNRHHPEALGLAGPEAYFNSGVLLMNLDALRRDGCGERLYRFAVDHRDQLMWPDQDALNLLLGHRRLPLHPRWNVTNALLAPWGRGTTFPPDAEAEARSSPAIRHFEGPGYNKPWHYRCEWELRDRYFTHRRQTPWPRVRLEGRPRAAAGRRLLRRLKARISA
jgi:lipopolysaccharide biosynthesis glycosyltransferase